MNSFGARLAALRKSKGLSQKALAEKLKIGTSTLGMYETGKREPNGNMLEALSDYFQVSIDYLLKGKETNADKLVLADLSSPVLSLDGREITGKEAEDIREFARFKLLQKHLEEEKNNN